ncbi:MAG: cytochrome c, mono- and diheme variant [Bacteroidota bacterium]|jgi:mono/diheme cytochrome c family protein
MEQIILYTVGGVIVFFCLFAIKTLRGLNKALKTSTFKNVGTGESVPRLQSSIAIGNLTFGVISSIIVLGLGAFYVKKNTQKHTPSVSDAAKAETKADETPKPTGATLDLATAVVLTDEPSLKAGAETFKNLCAACHGQAGEGIVGPNFADNFWIHGGEFKDLCKTIVEGVPDKGMISWAGQLSGDQIKQVASYILSLEGSTPPNQKAAQGTKVERKEAINFAIRPTAVATAKIPSIPLKGDKKKGEVLFNGTLGCGHCHGTGSIGHVDNRNLRALKKRYAGDAQKVYDTVMEIGRMGTAMPPWGHLSMVQKQDIKTFIFSIQE